MENGLRGIYAAVLTPYTDELACDHKLLARHCSRLLNEGCHGVSLFGTTGEGPALSAAEREKGLETVLADGVPKDKVLPATGAASLVDTIALTRHALSAGCRDILVMPPFFFKDVPDEGVYAYFRELIDRVGDNRARYYLYNFPAVTGVTIRRDVVGRLRRDCGSAIAGVKDSSGDMEYCTGLLADHPGIAVFTGWEALVPRLVAAGGSGNISGIANIAAKTLRAMFDEFAEAPGSARLKSVENLVTAVCANPITPALKFLNAHLRGEPAWRNIRPPLKALDSAAESAVIDALNGLD